MTTKFREPVNGLTHLVSAIAAFVGGVVLIINGWNGLDRIVSVIIYVASLVSMFSASAVYHLAKVKPRALEILRKIDHSAIFLLIAGTYTPICATVFTGFWRWGFLSIIWGIAFVGIIVKIFYIRAPRWLNAGMYVVMGWLSVLAFGQMLLLPASVLTWIIIGGVIYSLGAVVYATRIFNFFPGKFGFHEIWHLFVIGGAASHFIAILLLMIHLA
jgi:hemolysin III